MTVLGMILWFRDVQSASKCVTQDKISSIRVIKDLENAMFD